jgi:hypothetical protein
MCGITEVDENGTLCNECQKDLAQSRELIRKAKQIEDLK